MNCKSIISQKNSVVSLKKFLLKKIFVSKLLVFSKMMSDTTNVTDSIGNNS